MLPYWIFGWKLVVTEVLVFSVIVTSKPAVALLATATDLFLVSLAAIEISPVVEFLLIVTLVAVSVP